MNRSVVLYLAALLLVPGSRLSAAGNLFINEVLFEPPTSAEGPFEYIELRGASREVIPDKTYLLAVEGGSNNPGKIRNYFELGGREMGSNGFLVLLQKGHSYETVSGSTSLSNTASRGGWGDLPESTVGHCGDNARTNLANSPVTFLLVRCLESFDPHIDIDTNNDGLLDGDALTWTILDGVGLLGAEPTGSYGYGKINFIEAGGAASASNVVPLSFNPSYVGRNGHTTGWGSNDWVAADVVTNGVVKWKLATGNNVHPRSRAGALLNHIGGSNFGAPNNRTPLLSHSAALSGVMNHPGNPWLPLTISDSETAIASLRVSATSLDADALPTNQITVVYANSQWFVKFSPTNVCFNVPVRIRVSDGTNYSEDILPYAASGQWNTNVSFHIGISDASTAIPIDANLMLIGDDETFPLRLYSRTNCGLALAEFNFRSSLELTSLDGDELAEMDIESSSRFGNRFYWLGSLGNITDGPLAPNRNRLYATDLSGSGTPIQLTYVGRYDKLRNDILRWDAVGAHGKGAGYYGLETSAAILHPPKTNDGFNVEGFCFMANGGPNQAYLGLRAPLVPRGERRRALLIPVLNLSSLVASNPAAGPAQLGGPVELNLGGRGIRSLEYLNDRYWIIAGPPGDSTSDPYEFRLFTWSGNTLEPAQMWSANFDGLRPEGIVDLRTNSGTIEIQVVGDNGFSKPYEPASSSSAKKLLPEAFRQFRAEWVSIGRPLPLQVMEANFAATGSGQFMRGSGSSNQFLSVVEALDNMPGVRLDDAGGNADVFYAGHPWTNILLHWNAMNTSDALLFSNPIAAFGSMAGMPTLYVGRTYHFHLAAGTVDGTNHQSLRITAHDRTTGQQMGWEEMTLPNAADANYSAFFESGQMFSLPQYGLDSRIRPQFAGGAPSQEFTVEHRASKAEYFFVVSLSGQVPSNSVAFPLVWSGTNARPSPLYVLNFDFEPAWQSHFMAKPHLHGEPAPAAFLGQSVDDILATNSLADFSLVTTQTLSALTNVDLSPELRAHPLLDQLVSDFDGDPVALANYVFNEILLTDAFSPGAASGLLRSGGVRRGALAAYLEGQGSPLEQCALLVYLLRRCQVPAGYVFPAPGTLKLRQNSLERLFPFTIRVDGGTNTETLVPADFPYVAAYVDGAWRAVVPWLKDLEVQEGLDLTDYMPSRYRTGRDWVMGYLRFDDELMRLAYTSDTPTTLLPRYLTKMLQDNYTGLVLDDFGMRVRARKHHYSRWSDFPVPAMLTGTHIIVESLASLIQDQPGYSYLFESVEVTVTSTTNAARTLATGNLRLLDLQDRVLQLWFVTTNGNHTMNLGLNSFRPGLTNILSFSTLTNASLSSTESLNELRDTVLLDATDDDLTMRLQWSHHQPTTNGAGPGFPAVGLLQPDRATNALISERKLRKGDLTTLLFNVGRVSARMAESLAEDLKRAQALTNATGTYLRPEQVNGLGAYAMSAAYFLRTDPFRGALGRLYKIQVDGARAVAVGSLLARRQANGMLSSGDIQLSRPRLDICFRELSLVGNGTLRPGVNAGNERAVQDFLDLNALNEGAQEHQVLNDLFAGTNAISTVRLLQLSQLQGLLSQPGILRLTATNYAAYGNTEYGDGAGQKKLKEFDPSLWQTIESTFLTPGLSNATLVLMTPGEVNSAVGKRVGALILSPRCHAALLSPGINGGENPDQENPAAVIGANLLAGIRLMASTGEFLSLEQFGHDLNGGSIRVSINQRTDGAVFYSLEVVVDANHAFASSGEYIPVPADRQMADIVDFDPETGRLLLDDYGLSPNTSNQELLDIMDSNGFLSRAPGGGTFGNLVGDPVSTLNGEFAIDETDLSLPGPLPLMISRNYSSRGLAEGDFGQNWKMNLNPYLVLIPSQKAIDAAELDGTVLRYTKVGTNFWKPLWQDNVSYDNSSGPPGPARNLINRAIAVTNSATVTNYVVYPGDGSARVYSLRGFPKNGKSYWRPWLSEWVDPVGNKLRFEFGEDPQAFDYGKVRRISSTSGAAGLLRYNERGLISELLSKDGQRVTYAYNRWGDLTEVTRPDGSKVSYAYLFAPSRNSSAVLTNSIQAWVAFTNQQGTVDYQRGIIGSFTWTNLVSTHRIIREEKPDGRVLINDYDPKGRVIRQYANVGLDERPVLNASFIYDNNDTTRGVAAGLISGSTAVIDGFGNTNRFYYSASKLYLVTDAERGEEKTSWYNDWIYYDPVIDWEPYALILIYQEIQPESYPRSKASMTDRRGLLTRFKYDFFGNATNITVKGDLLGDGRTNTAVTAVSYNINKLPERLIHPNGTTNRYFYTNQFLLSREEIWPLGATASDAITNLYTYTSVSNAVNGFASYGLLSMEVRAAGTPDAATNRYEYDERGYLTRVIRPTGTDDPDVVLTNLYSARGWLEEQSDAAGRRIRYAYDAMGRIQQRQVFENGTAQPMAWDFTHYNENGEVVWTDGPRFNPEDYVWRDYDGGGRQTQEIHWRSRAKADGTGVEAETATNEFSMTFADYDVFGNQTRTLDARGNITSNRFDRIGQLIQRERYSSEGAFLLREQFGYEPGGSMAAHTNALNSYTLMRYNGRGQPASRRNPDGSTNGWRYNADGRVQREYARNGAYWANSYDDKNRQITRIFYDPANVPQATNVTWLDRRGNPIRFEDEAKHSFTNTYDALDRLKASWGPVVAYAPPPGAPGMTTQLVQQAITNSYDAAGAVFTSRNVVGDKSIISRDVLGRTTREEVWDTNNGLIREVSMGYSTDHHSVTTTNGSGSTALVSTTYTDNDGQPVLSVVHPGPGVRESDQATFDPAGNLVATAQQSSSNGTVTIWTTASFAYDALDRRQSQRDRDGALTTFIYDADGNLTTRVLPGGQQWRASYNSASQRISDYVYVSANVGTRSNTYIYHPPNSPLAGLLQTRTDGRGVMTTYSYDAWLRIIAETHAGPLPEQNLATVWTYDARGLATKISENFTARSTGSATDVLRSFDPYGLLAQENVLVDGVPRSNAGQSWDSAGRRSGLGFGVFGFNYTWNADGTLASSAGRTGGGSYSYDTAGRLQSRRVGVRTTTVGHRDGAGRVLTRQTTIFGQSPSAQLNETLSWTGDGLLAAHTQARADFTDNRRYTYASQTRRLIEERLDLDATQSWTNTFTFDEGRDQGQGVLTKIGRASPSQWSGGVDAFSRVSRETNTILRQTASGRINAYGPDAMVSINVDGRPQPVTVMATGNSNFPTQWRAMLELTPGAHQLSANVRQTFGAFNVTSNRWFTNIAAHVTRDNIFDGEGQITQRIWRNPNGTTNRVHTLTWDARGRLLGVVERDRTQSGLNWSAVYDALGRRSSSMTLLVTNGGTSVQSPTTLISWFDPEVEFLEVGVSVNGSAPTWKLYGPDADGDFGGQNGRGGFDAIVPGPDSFCPVLSDARGDVLAVYHENDGQLHWNEARPTAYGGAPGYRPLPLGHGADLVSASAHGGIWPDSTGYYWRGARYYDGESGQWLSFDPYGFAAGPNPYGYPDDPINYHDPDGRLGRGLLQGRGRALGGREETPASILGATIGQMFGATRAAQQGVATGRDYQQNLSLFEGNHFNALNQTFNPATRALFGFSQAYDGMGLNSHNQGQRLSGGQRAIAFGEGVMATAETVLAAEGIRTAPGTLRGFRLGVGPSPSPTLGVRKAAEAAPKLLNLGINVIEQGMQHVLERHIVNGIPEFAGKSKFTTGVNLEELIQQGTQMPMVRQANGNFARTFDAGRGIGIDRATGQASSTVTIITRPNGNLVTMFPGAP